MEQEFEQELLKEKRKYQNSQLKFKAIAKERPVQGPYIDVQKNQQQKQVQNDKPIKYAILSQKLFNTQAIWEVIENDMTNYQWQISTNQNHELTKADFVFIQNSPIIYHDIEGKQMSTLLKGNAIFQKTGFSQLLKDFDNHFKSQQYQIKSCDFYPRDFILKPNDPQINQDEQKFLNIKNSKSLWIQKDDKGSSGRGIEIITDLKQFQDNFINFKLDQENKQKQNQQLYQDIYDDFVVQEYIQNPLQFKEDLNRKCDYRVMILILFTGQNWVIYIQDIETWFVRCSLQNYEKNSQDILAHTTHQQNLYKQKNKIDEKDYNEQIENLQYEGKVLKDYILQKDNKNYEKIIKKAYQSLTYTILAGLNKINNHNIGQFRVLGADCMFDEDFNFYLFEVNSAPDLKLASPLRTKLSTNFAKDIVNTVMEFHDNWKNMDQFSSTLENVNQNNSLIITYNGSKNYNILEEN